MFRRVDNGIKQNEQSQQEEEIMDEPVVVDEEIIEEIKARAEDCGVDEKNMYYNILLHRQQKNIECIESTGASDKHGKPCGFRRSE